MIEYSKNWPDRVLQKRNAVIKLALKFGLTTAAHLGYFAGLGRSATYKTVADLKKRGVLQTVSASSVPCEVFTLTQLGYELGASLAKGWVRDFENFEPQPHPKAFAISHNLLASYCLLILARDVKDADSITSESELRSLSGTSRSRNVPDGLLRIEPDSGTQFWALELQESPESKQAIEKRLSYYGDQFLGEHFDGVYIASTQKYILDSYRRALDSGVKPWNYDARKKEHYRVADGPSPITPEMKEHQIKFWLVDEYKGLFTYR